MELVTVYVPTDGQPVGPLAKLAPGSALVGEPLDSGDVAIHYEGNLYGASGLEQFANRVRIAAGRHAEGYPKTARAVVPAESVVPVGEYDCREQVIRLTGPEGERLLAAWLGVDAVDPAELIARS